MCKDKEKNVDFRMQVLDFLQQQFIGFQVPFVPLSVSIFYVEPRHKRIYTSIGAGLDHFVFIRLLYCMKMTKKVIILELETYNFLEKMKYLSSLLILVLFTSCQITETIIINSEGSGTIKVEQLRDENSYMQLAGEEYSKENIFEDTTYVFREYIDKFKENFSKYTPQEQELFRKYENVNVHLKKSSFEKEFKNELSLHFNKVSEIPDLYKTEDYASDIQHNYALTAENHYYRIGYDFDGEVFKRTITIINTEELEKAKQESEKFTKRYGASNLMQIYVLKYHFPKSIKSVSNPKAVISSDKKSLSLEFKISDFYGNPEISNLEVVLE